MGLMLNASNTLVLTTGTRPPSEPCWQIGVKVGMLPRGDGHKWLGCMFTVPAGHDRLSETNFRIHAAARAFYGHKRALCHRNVSIQSRLKYFEIISRQ